jgi:hypothetical protein
MPLHECSVLQNWEEIGEVPEVRGAASTSRQGTANLSPLWCYSSGILWSAEEGYSLRSWHALWMVSLLAPENSWRVPAFAPYVPHLLHLVISCAYLGDVGCDMPQARGLSTEKCQCQGLEVREAAWEGSCDERLCWQAQS